MRVSQQDREAQNELYSIYYARIYRFCRREFKNPDDIENLVHQTFSTAFEKIDQFDHPGDRPRFRYWLMKIAHFKILTLKRNMARERERHEKMIEESVSHRHNNTKILSDSAFSRDVGEEKLFFSPDEEQQLQMIELENVLKMMEKKYSANTWLSFYCTLCEGRSAKEVAAELDIPENTARKYKSRVLEAIRDYFRDVLQLPAPTPSHTHDENPSD